MDQAEIRSFLKRYAKGDYNEAEHSQFIDWLRSAPIKEIEKIAEEYRIIAEPKPLPEHLQARIIDQIETALNRREFLDTSARHPKKRIMVLGRKQKLTAAAAIALLIAGSITYWLTGKTSFENNRVKTVIAGVQDVHAPQVSKATITLGNGQVISLDSVENGVLTKQGDVDIIKTAEGDVSYKSATGMTAPDSITYNTLYNPRGSRVVSLTLADGTRVWLNSESSLRYPVSFTGKDRKVRITGEAYFEVAKNSSKQFVVDADGVLTEVLGTHFNVKAYKDDGHTAVTLLQGVVRVAFSGGSVIIKPGQQAVATSSVHMIKNPDLESVMAWKNGEFVMKSADIHSIMRQVARWYDVDVVYEGGIPAARISGEVSRNLNLTQILQVLKYSGIQVKVDGRRVIVTP